MARELGAAFGGGAEERVGVTLHEVTGSINDMARKEWAS